MQTKTLPAPAHGWLKPALIAAIILLIISVPVFVIVSIIEIRSRAFTSGWPDAADWQKITNDGDVVADHETRGGCDDPSQGQANPTGESDKASQAVCQDPDVEYNPGNNGQPGATDDNTYSAGFYYYDPSADPNDCSGIEDDFLYFTLRLGDKVLASPASKGLVNNRWYALIDKDGDEIPDWYVRVDGFGDADEEIIEVLYETTGDDDADGEPIVWNSADFTIELIADGYGRGFNTGADP